MADLEQPVGHGVPVTQQVRVVQDAEKQGAADPEKRTVLYGGADDLGGERRIERELVLQVDHRVAHRVEAGLLELCEVPSRYCAARRQLLRPRSQKVRRQHVAERRLVDRLDGVLQEQTIAPGDQVVQVLHHHVVLVGDRAGARHHVGLEGLLLDRPVALKHHLLCLDLIRAEVAVRRAEQHEQVVDVFQASLPPEGEGTPVALGSGDRGIGAGRVENEVEPLLRLGKPLVVAEVNAHHDGDMVQQFPVVDGVRAAEPRRSNSSGDRPGRLCCWLPGSWA